MILFTILISLILLISILAIALIYSAKTVFYVLLLIACFGIASEGLMKLWNLRK